MTTEDFQHPMAWHNEEEAQGAFIGSADAEPTLLDMPSGVSMRKRLAMRGDQPISSASRAVLADIQSALDALASGSSGAALLPLDGLAQDDRDFLDETLGDGEVSIAIGGVPDYQIEETVLPGVWRGRATHSDGTVVADWIEITDVPAVLREVVGVRCRESFKPPSEAPEGAMNALPVLLEISERMKAYRMGQENHVINFTLLPMSEVDSSFLTGTLGRLPLSITSSGYGTCRVFATHMRHVWAVQFLNAMDTVILDTLEIGDVPVSVRAGQEDFEDSAERLREIVEAYLT